MFPALIQRMPARAPVKLFTQLGALPLATLVYYSLFQKLFICADRLLFTKNIHKCMNILVKYRFTNESLQKHAFKSNQDCSHSNLNSRPIRTCAGLSYLFRNMSLVGLHTYYITVKIMNIKLILWYYKKEQLHKH